MTAGLSLADARLDTEDWRLRVSLADPATGLPYNLTGSDLKVSFRATVDGAPVAECSTASGDGSLAIVAPPTAGLIDIVSRAAMRTWRVPVANSGRLDLPQTVQGDVLRRPSSDPNGPVEALATIKILVRSGTTSWPTNP